MKLNKGAIIFFIFAGVVALAFFGCTIIPMFISLGKYFWTMALA